MPYVCVFVGGSVRSNQEHAGMDEWMAGYRRRRHAQIRILALQLYDFGSAELLRRALDA